MQQTRPFVRVRAASEHDLSELARLDREAFPASPYPYFVLRQFVVAFADHLLVAEEEGQMCGYVLATPPREARSWIFSLGVAPGRRGQGLGRALMRESLERLRRLGTGTVHTWVDPGNTPAVLLYKSLGFVLDATEPEKDYFGPGEHRLLMTLTL
ncbi:N-acetyltransferase family protein [Streptomyces sp. NPDC002623]|uniref:GNAT family N-acetyltransferase n=1 Tax=Streptomyces sp. NPDC020951 TaxID=3365104 RepID=UPI00379D7BC5